MPPKKNYKGIMGWLQEKADGLGTPIDDKILERYPEEDSNIGTNTFMSNWAAKKIYNTYEKSDNSAPPGKERDGYGKTYVKGESELLTRLMGLEPRYTYENTSTITDDAFKSGNLMGTEGKGMEWNSGEFRTYDPKESPIIEVEPNVFEVNPKTKAGKSLQDRIDMSYSQARERNKYYGFLNQEPGYEPNLNLPDEYKNRSRMLKGEEPLLGDIYFEEDGAFRDLWNLDLDDFEIPFDSGYNAARLVGAPIMTENRPVVRGKARNRTIK